MESLTTQKPTCPGDGSPKPNDATIANQKQKTVSILFGTHKTADYQLLLYSEDEEVINEWKDFSFIPLPQHRFPTIRLVPPSSDKLPVNTWSYSAYTKREICSILYYSQLNQNDDLYFWQRFEDKHNAMYFFSEDRRHVYSFTICGMHRLEPARKSRLTDGVPIAHNSFIVTNADSFAFVANLSLTELLKQAQNN